MRYDLQRGFPLITTKRVHFRSIAYELLWFLRGDRNVGWLQEHGVTIWDEWAAPDGRPDPVGILEAYVERDRTVTDLIDYEGFCSGVPSAHAKSNGSGEAPHVGAREAAHA